MNHPTIFHRLERWLAGKPRRAALSGEENHWLVEPQPWNHNPRERWQYDREEVLRQALEAWRVNPLARRIVGLTTQYVVGGGLRVRAAQPAAHGFLQEWWQHRLNQLPMRVYEWCDELSRSGELFFLLSTGADGMSYLRAVPASEITAVETAPNDIQQELAYTQKGEDPGQPLRWSAYCSGAERGDDGSFAPVMLHYAINRPVGAVRGESDLAPLLRWLSRYVAWLEDRARLNRYRNSFLFVVKGRWNSEAERLMRQNQLAASPPPPGSFLVTDETETWEVIHPKLESHEAGEDGLALKKMIAAGAALPLHFLAEPESTTRTTAESAGGPTYRHFEQRQQFFLWLISDLARVALERAALARPGIDPRSPVQVDGADLSARDNAALAVAMTTVTSALETLRDRALIDDAELLRLAYKFAGEVVDVEGLLARAAREPAPAVAPGGRTNLPPAAKLDPDTGEPLGIAKIS